MAKPKTIRCSKCQNCAVDYGVGFAVVTKYICTKFDMQVSKDDGCTFGMFGKPNGYIARPGRVDNVDPVVYGRLYL